MNSKHQPILRLINDGIMIVLALVSGYFLVLEEITILTPEQLMFIDQADIFIALIFLMEFFLTLYFAKHRGLFFKSRWWELLAAIPISTTVTQALRLLRLLRIVRLFRIGAHVAIAEEK